MQLQKKLRGAMITLFIIGKIYLKFNKKKSTHEITVIKL